MDDDANARGPLIERVRALLAKAESTPFEHEAEAFTAKAQELIARHALDEALLHTPDDTGEPSTCRIEVADTYASARVTLVGAVAHANRCRAVYRADTRVVTVYGFPGDLDAVELLSASLLVQATSTMVRQGPRRDASGRSRTRAFRRAFLMGFAHRIGERLVRATESAVDEVTARDGRLVPVLAAREQRVEAAVRRAHPRLAAQRRTQVDRAGWFAGRDAADTANLTTPVGRLAGE